MSPDARKEAYRLDAERIVKRFKKVELVGYVARTTEARDEREKALQEQINKLDEENQALKSQLKNLKTIQDIVALVIQARTGASIDGSEQMTMLFAERHDGAGNETSSPTSVLEDIIDNCEAVCEEIGGGHGAPSYLELDSALELALEDRAALLKRLGLTDREWSMQGGASETELTP